MSVNNSPSLDKSPIHCIEFNSNRWYCLGDIANYFGYLEYALKWPRDTISVIETRSEIDERDPVEYVGEPEFFVWLTWKYEYQRDAKVENLYDLVIAKNRNQSQIDSILKLYKD